MNALDRTKAAFPCVCGEDGRKTSIHANGCYSQCGRWNDIAAVVEAAERDAIERCIAAVESDWPSDPTFGDIIERLRALKEQSHG